MDPVSISALVVSIGSVIGYLIKKRVKKSSCTSTMQVDLSNKTKQELHTDLNKDLRIMKHDIINELSPHIMSLNIEISKLKEQYTNSNEQ